MVARSRILAVASALIAGASAAAVRRQDSSNSWLATNYTWGSSPGGCIADFFLLGFDDIPSGAPSFDVQCSPVYIQEDWVACKNSDGSEMDPQSVVYAVWQESSPDDPKHYINIAHVYYREEDGLYYDAQTDSDGFVPEQGGSEWFGIASVLPASESHLPPPTLSDNVTVTDPVPPAGEDIPDPEGGSQDSGSDTEPTEPTQSVDTSSVSTQTDTPAPTQTDASSSEPTQSDTPDLTQDDDASSAPSESKPASDDPAPTDEVLSQPLRNSGEPNVGKIPPGGDGA